MALLAGCTPMPQRPAIPTQWLASPNFDERRPNLVIVHHTGSADLARALATLTGAASEVSAHYVIDRDGTIWQLVDERARAWHAGRSYWGGFTDLNSSSLGIELVNDGDQTFAEPQIAALLRLLADVRDRLRIPPENVLGHGDVAPGRKVDPSARFPWNTLAAHGFGLWCSPEEAREYAIRDRGRASREPSASSAPGDPQRDGGDAALAALQAVGYDVAEPQAAIAAFRRHFRGDDATTLGADDLALLRCLAARRAARANGGER